jgi:hypothetical protein
LGTDIHAEGGSAGAQVYMLREGQLEQVAVGRVTHRAPTPPPPLRVAKTGKNHLNDINHPLLPTGIGERFSQTISIFLGHAALLRRCELPPYTKVLN